MEFHPPDCYPLPNRMTKKEAQMEIAIAQAAAGATLTAAAAAAGIDRKTLYRWRLDDLARKTHR